MSGITEIGRALAVVSDILSLVKNATQASAEITALISKANAEGRKDLTPQEWASVLGSAQEARDNLAAKLGVK